MQQRKDELQSKKAKLEEMRRQREERQREFAASRQSLGSPPGVCVAKVFEIKVDRLTYILGHLITKEN